MPVMPSWVLFHRTSQVCRVAMQATSYTPSPSYSFSYLRFQPKRVFTYGHSSTPTQSFSCTQFILNNVPRRESKAFAGTKLLQAAQLSGKSKKTNTETKISKQVHKNAEAETQRALLDYLHDTRNLHFTYAEHMATNAPTFVRKLLLKAKAGKDIRKAVDKYLQYNPINEFEPFFESIGIEPSDVGALLAPDQIYLSENTVLMYNVSTLWDYGIPRNRLGQIYKEEKDIFGYPPGVLQGMFQAYENLGLSKACLAKVFYCCPFLLKDNVNKEFDVLLNTLYGLGMGKDQICSFLESNPSNWRGISEKLRLLDNLGCPRDEVSTYVRANPHAFAECSDKCFHSKVNFFKKLKMINKDIGKAILQHPEILRRDIHKSTAEDIKLWTGKGLDQTDIQGIVQKTPHVLGTQRESKAFAGTKLPQAAQTAQLSGKAIKTNTETKISNHVHINAKAETQRALRDYLHDTRNLHFTYAEHMAMNAPSFVTKLLAKARAGKDIRKAVDKYLQYNPINEFEPFFESIGIEPSEVGALLAPDQIYLSENTVLMHNVSTLWDYGIPRNRLGQIYKEEKDIFSYPPGVLQGMFQAYENLGLSKACLAKVFYCCPFLLKGNLSKEFDELLNTLYGLGMGKDQICSFLESNPSNWRGISKKLRLLDSLGCPRDEVSTYVRANLHAFAECSEKCLHSKVKFFKKLRIINKDIGKIILQYPEILRQDINKSTAENIKLWTGKGLDQTEIQGIVQNNPHVLGTRRESKAFAGTKLPQAAQLLGKAVKTKKLLGKAVKTNTETKISNQVHSNAKAETQKALLDYLHDTRNLHFTYAEHMAMNAPSFVIKLLAKAKARKNIRKAVDEYLQYNPINEFEPFFESIGIEPSAVGALLAPDQIYLSENTVLMHNVSTLWDYGIPRNRLGQIYKEEKDIFSYPPGVLQGMFQAYENLGLSKACLAKVFYCCPFLLKGNINKEFDVLLNTLYGLGMGKDQICSFLESNPSNWRGIYEKLMLFDSLGCPKDEVNRYVRTNLHAFTECSDKFLHSKVNFFKKLRMINKDIGKIVLQHPEILRQDIHKFMAEDIKLWPGEGLDQTEIQGTRSFKSMSEQMTGFPDMSLIRDIHKLTPEDIKLWPGEGLDQTEIQGTRSFKSMSEHMTGFPDRSLIQDIHKLTAEDIKLWPGEGLDQTQIQGTRSIKSMSEQMTGLPDKSLIRDIHKLTAEDIKLWPGEGLDQTEIQGTGSFKSTSEQMTGFPDRSLIRDIHKLTAEDIKLWPGEGLDQTEIQGTRSFKSMTEQMTGFPDRSLIRDILKLTAEDIKLWPGEEGTRSFKSMSEQMTGFLDRSLIRDIHKLTAEDIKLWPGEVSDQTKIQGTQSFKSMNEQMTGFPDRSLIRDINKLTAEDIKLWPGEGLDQIEIQGTRSFKSMSEQMTGFPDRSLIQDIHKLMSKDIKLWPGEGLDQTEIQDTRSFKSMSEHMTGFPDRSLIRDIHKLSAEDIKLCPGEGLDQTEIWGTRSFKSMSEQMTGFPDRSLILSSEERQKLSFLSELGFDENSVETLVIAKKMKGGVDTLRERMTCLMDFGLSSDGIRHMVRSNPETFSQSRDKLQKKVNFLLNAGYSVKSLLSYPYYLSCGLGSKIEPRCRLLEWLNAKNAFKKKYSLDIFFGRSDKRFLSLVGSLHPDSNKVFQHFKQKSGKAQL